MKKTITKSMNIVLIIVALVALVAAIVLAIHSTDLRLYAEGFRGADKVAFVDLSGKISDAENVNDTTENDVSKSQAGVMKDKKDVMTNLVGSDKEREIMDSIGEYVVCSKVYQKNFNEDKGKYLSDELKESLNNRNLIDNVLECPYDCDEYYENGDCIHTEEIVNSGEWEPAVKIEYDQNETIPWRGGTIAVSEAKAGIISFNMYDMTGGDGSSILYVVKLVCDDAGDTINARAVYDIYKDSVVEIRY